jgi:hypothetical protein
VASLRLARVIARSIVRDLDRFAGLVDSLDPDIAPEVRRELDNARGISNDLALN